MDNKAGSSILLLKAVLLTLFLSFLLGPGLSYGQTQLPNNPVSGAMPQGQGSYDPSAGGAIPQQQEGPPVQGGTPWYEQVPQGGVQGQMMSMPMTVPGQMGVQGQAGMQGQMGTPGSMGTPGQGTTKPGQMGGTRPMGSSGQSGLSGK
jgi:hypothetical protein